MADPRIFFDLTSIARWTGPPVGIVRAQQELARYARRCRPDVVFTLFDLDRRVWRQLSVDWVDSILARKTIVEMSMMRDPTGSKHSCLNVLPSPMRNSYFWVTKLRRKLLFLAEDVRLTSQQAGVRQWAHRATDRLMKSRERDYFFDRTGMRRDCPNFRRVAGPTVVPTSRDTTVAAQFDWAHTDIQSIRQLKQRHGFRHVVLCYDIIPIVHPEWYFDHDVRLFERYYRQALATADTLIVNAQRTATDLQEYCHSKQVNLPPTHIVPLGADPPKPVDLSVALPSGLHSQSYAMYVSTIEPRKNHAMLVRVWKRLLREGVPQRHQFKLVFVGRPGWKMEDFLPSLQSDGSLENTIQVLHGIDDRLLARLYHEAGFCLYPSVYEGFGLPAAEALAYGKPLLASAGGSIPEAVGPHVPCLDPHDEQAWYQAMKEWIESPQARTGQEAIQSMRPLAWEQAAQRFFSAVDQSASHGVCERSRPHSLGLPTAMASEMPLVRRAA